jgi:hypothetical protein
MREQTEAKFLDSPNDLLLAKKTCSALNTNCRGTNAQHLLMELLNIFHARVSLITKHKIFVRVENEKLSWLENSAWHMPGNDYGENVRVFHFR